MVAKDKAHLLYFFRDYRNKSPRFNVLFRMKYMSSFLTVEGPAFETKLESSKSTMLQRSFKSFPFKHLNERWERQSLDQAYRKYALKESCYRIADQVKETMMDGIFFNLKEKTNKKSYRFQKRQMRRIIEKRQAQAVHKIVGRSKSLFTNRMVKFSTSKCWTSIRNAQACI